MIFGAGSSGTIRAFFVILLFPLVLLLSACPPPVSELLATAVTDKLPPTITVTSPKVGQTYTATVTFTGTIIDDAVTVGDGKGVLHSIDYTVANDVLRKGKITIATDGTTKQDTTFGTGTITYTKATGAFTFSISTVSPTALRGLLTVIIDAADANGNTSSSTVQLSESSGPVITLTSPTGTNLKYTAGTTVLTLSGTVANASDDLTHDDNISSLAWGVTGKNWGASITVVDGTTSYSVPSTGSLIPQPIFTFNTTTGIFSTTFLVPYISDSSLILTVTASDKNGHVTTSTNYLVADVAGPQLTFFSATSGVFYSSSHYTPQQVSGNLIVAPPAAFQTLTFVLNTATYTPTPADVSGTVNTTTGNFTFPLLAAGETLAGQSGPASVTITAVDSKNRTTVASYNIIEDNTPPTISGISVHTSNSNATHTKVGDVITLTFQATDLEPGLSDPSRA